MGFLSDLFSQSSEIEGEQVERDFESFLVRGEEIEKAFKIQRDLIVFTGKRLILMDKEGLLTNRRSFQSIPYRNIITFSMDTTGRFESGGVILLWLSGLGEPVTLEFSKNKFIEEIYQTLSEYVIT
ncbi:MAG: PH domain-containing protein [Balneolaceae bacterium]|nr:PH domain-containing protein [Balneolaceae bacterium]